MASREPEESIGAIGETAELKGHHDLKTAGRDIKESGGQTRTTLDFAEMAAEFDWDRLWGNRTGSEIGQTFGINLCVGLLPTLFDVGMDSLAVRDYLNGTYYYKQTGNYSGNGSILGLQQNFCMVSEKYILNSKRVDILETIPLKFFPSR